jgi:hypothetical protein
MEVYRKTEVRSQGTEDRMVCTLWRNYLLSGLAAFVFIVDCGHSTMRVYVNLFLSARELKNRKS